MVTHPNETGQSSTHSSKNNHKDYLRVGPHKSLEVPKELDSKQKELRFRMDLGKDSEVTGTPFLFDVLA